MAEASAPSADPCGVGAQPRFFQQRPQRHAGIDDVVDHPVGELAAVQLRAAPFHAGVGRAFEEIDVRFSRGKRMIGLPS
jgi:hypothetical protein